MTVFCAPMRLLRGRDGGVRRRVRAELGPSGIRELRLVAGAHGSGQSSGSARATENKNTGIDGIAPASQPHYTVAPLARSLHGGTMCMRSTAMARATLHMHGGADPASIWSGIMQWRPPSGSGSIA